MQGNKHSRSRLRCTGNWYNVLRETRVSMSCIRCRLPIEPKTLLVCANASSVAAIERSRCIHNVGPVPGRLSVTESEMAKSDERRISFRRAPVHDQDDEKGPTFCLNRWSTE